MRKRYRLLFPIILSLAIVLSSSAGPVLAGQAVATGPQIVRDPYGVPHIYASTSYDLFYGVGYVTAQDRLSQLDLFRRAALGRLAEILPEMVEADKEARRSLYTAEERMALFESLPASEQEILEAYRDGINAWLAKVQANPSLLPFEFIMLGYTPEPWQVTDSIAVLQFMSRQFGEFGGAGGQELQNQALYQDLVDRFGRSLGEAIFNDVVWLDDPAAPTTVTGPAISAAPPPMPGTPLRIADNVLEEVQARLRAIEQAYERLGIPTRLGSYWWAVAPSRSATGNAMLFGGPQMGHPVPNPGYEMGMHGPGIDVVGMASAGAPGILIGHNGHLAFSVTSGFGDQVDVYVELLHPTDPYRYWYNGSWQAMSRRTETIAVKGSAPITIEVARTVHGPVLAWDLANGIALSERRAHEGLEYQMWEGTLQIDAARTVEEAMAVVERFPLSFNILFADTNGHIGYRQAGRQPVRAAGFDRRLPLPGTGQAEWQGFLPPEAMPHVFDPPSGMLGNWNNKPMPGWINGDPVNWGIVDRVQRIFDLLASSPVLTPDQFKEIARDIGRHDYRADALLPYLLEAMDAPAAPSDPRLAQARQILSAWDHRADEGAVGESLFNMWRTYVFSDTLGDELGSYLVTLQDPFNPTGDSLLLRILLGPDASLPVARDYFNGADPAFVLVNSLIKAMDTLAAQYGTDDMTQWGWDPGTIDFTLGPFTFGQVPWYSRGSYMQFIELRQPLARGENVMPPGESGTILIGPDGNIVLDPHFLDQLSLFRNWTYKPMPLYYMPLSSYLPVMLR
jgi:penicillin amidase